MKNAFLTVTCLTAIVLGAIAFALPVPATPARTESQLVHAVQLHLVAQQKDARGEPYYTLGQQVDAKQLGTNASYFALVWVNPAAAKGELRVSFQLGGKSFALGNMEFTQPGGTSSTPFPLIVSLYPSEVADESRGKPGKLRVELVENGKVTAQFSRDGRIQ